MKTYNLTVQFWIYWTSKKLLSSVTLTKSYVAVSLQHDHIDIYNQCVDISAKLWLSERLNEDKFIFFAKNVPHMTKS